MVMSLYQNGGQRLIVKFHNTSFERGEDFKYLGTTLMKRNSIQGEKLEVIFCRIFCRPICYQTLERLRNTQL